MPKSALITFNITEANLSLAAQICTSDGKNITSFITQGFVNLGGGFYSFEYTNYPENFRGIIKIYNATNLGVPVYATSIDTVLIDVQTITDYAYDYGETLQISYSDITGKTIYALLFNAYNLNQAYTYNATAKTFSTYTLDVQNTFPIYLTENPNRLGYYSASVENATTIAKVNATNYYLIEIWQQSGSVASRIADKNVGYLRLYWGGDQAHATDIARTVWTYEPRNLTQPASLNVAGLGNINILPGTSSNNGSITF